ncbi:MAG: class I SAM-dependent methyltransferase [Desulfomonilaceae bacterium]
MTFSVKGTYPVALASLRTPYIQRRSPNSGLYLANMKGYMMSEYLLQVGKKGFDRLKFINDVFGEHSKNFLIRAGITEGKRVLEVGCGTGSMTTWLAKQVGMNGQVIAVDASEEQLEIARKAAEKSGFTNIEFIWSTIEALDLRSDFIDLAYSRLLLMHLRDPERVLVSINKYLKPGGVIACEEPHAGSLTTTPRNEHIERFNELFIQLGKLQGFDFNIGDKLYSILKSAGYSQLHAVFVQPVISMAEAIDFVLMAAAELSPVAVKSGMVSEKDVKKMLLDLQNSRSEEDSYYTFPRQAQIFGYKR